MSEGPIGQRHKRNEDPRLLTGRAEFLDDIVRPGMLHVAFLRSPHAHARSRSIDLEAARSAPGVVAAMSAERSQRPLAASHAYSARVSL